MSQWTNKPQVPNTMRTKIFNYPQLLCVLIWLGLNACAERAQKLIRYNQIIPLKTYSQESGISNRQ